MAKCSFCDKHIEIGKGIIYVAPDSVYNFCSSKCMKNSRLGREKRKVMWIRKTRISKEELKQELLEAGKEKEEATKKQEIAKEKEVEKQETKPEKKEEKAEEKQKLEPKEEKPKEKSEKSDKEEKKEEKK